jgi:hypothetical protein
MKTYRAKHLTGYEQPDGAVVWIDNLWTHVGTTRNGEGYQVLTNGIKSATVPIVNNDNTPTAAK